MILKKLSIFAVFITLVCLCLVSCGSVKIPDIVNVDEMSAKNLLSSNALIPVVIYEYSNNVAEGCVIKTDPTIGSSVEKNSKVTVYVSKGVEATDKVEANNSAELRVPDISNTSEDFAKNYLTTSQLVPLFAYEYSDTVTKGNVIRTEPEIGTAVESGEQVTVYISLGSSYIKASSTTIESSTFLLDSCSVYKKEGKLYIECLGFGYIQSYSAEWIDDEGTGYLSGAAAEEVDSQNYFTIFGKYPEKNWNTGNRQNITLEIPLNELRTDEPNRLYIKFNLKIRGVVTNNYNDLIILTITW